MDEKRISKQERSLSVLVLGQELSIMAEQLVLIPEEQPETIAVAHDEGTEAVSPPLGLFYFPEFLSTNASDVLTAHVDSGPWLTDIARRVQHYGFKYDSHSERRGSVCLEPWDLQAKNG